MSISIEFNQLRKRIGESILLLEKLIDPEAKEIELKILEEMSSGTDFWKDADNAKDVLGKKSCIEREMGLLSSIRTQLEEYVDLGEIAIEDEDEDMLSSIVLHLRELSIEAENLCTTGLFSGEADRNDCFVEIHTGAGGTDSNDWASMLLRMYMRFGERLGYRVSVVHIYHAEEAGIKSCCLRIKGSSAYGWFKTESGVHRLVRLSRFNTNNKRMTSFASCWVYPDDTNNRLKIEIDEKDLRIDTYKSSGAGGQHVNTTDSAVRITHLASGIVVQSQTERSQHRNKAEAFRMLKARLYERQLREKQLELDQQNAEKGDNGWGNQIRSYVMHPYTMVKDLRTNYETSDVNSVLDGALHNIIRASLVSGLGGVRGKKD